MSSRLVLIAFSFVVWSSPAPAQWPAPKALRVPATRGYVVIPNAAVAPDRARTYRAIFDATRPASSPSDLLPAVNMAGAELNAFDAAGVPPKNVRLAIVFHGGALDGILDEDHYRAKHGTANPNVRALEQLKRAGVDLFVCGQNLAAERIDPKTLTPLVRVASSASIVLTEYQNRGYALLSF